MKIPTYKKDGREFRQSSVYQVNDIWFCIIKWKDTGLYEKFYYDDIQLIVSPSEVVEVVSETVEPIVEKKSVEFKTPPPLVAAAQPKKKKAAIKNEPKLQQKLF